MKNKFLSLAVATALLALVVLPTAFGASNDAAEASVEVTGDSTFTLTLTNNMETMAFTATAYMTNTARSIVMVAAADKIEVADYTGAKSGKEGHEVDIKLNKATWYYDDTETNVVSPAYWTTNNTPGSDAIYLRLVGTDQSVNPTSVATATGFDCTTATGSITSSVGRTLTSGYFEIINSDETCPVDASYRRNQWKMVGPSNGFATGTYTIGATIRATDGNS